MTTKLNLIACALTLVATHAALPGSSARAAPDAPSTQPARYFTIEVVDEQTGRGVPLVELKTVSHVRYLTDSAGLIALDDPSYWGQTVFFYVSSHGYEYPKDGFGFRGVRLDVTPGGRATVKVKRLNVAERLYRVTGEGIYRDSVLLGRPGPIRQPVLNAQVSGQDSVQSVVYNGRIHFFWGDTLRVSYPLGHFWMAGATSRLPADGGLDPARGVDLDYFVDDNGFSRGVVPRVDGLLAWLDAFLTVPGPGGTGSERLVAKTSLQKSLTETVGRRLEVWNDDKSMFEPLKEIPLDAPLYPLGHPVRVEADGAAWFYFGLCAPNVRCRAAWNALQDLPSYEGFTCLKPGHRWRGPADTQLDRDASGKLVWAWKRDTAVPDDKQLAELIKAGRIKPDEVWFRPRDVEGNGRVTLGMGSVAYNAYRKKWIMIAGEVGGKTSYLGEIWYSEAAKPEGPWRSARKIVTHDCYSLYNPRHHPFYDQDGGRVIYFEGTYTYTFSREGDPTPRYDYNQIMHRLDLGDPRLKLPD